MHLKLLNLVFNFLKLYLKRCSFDQPLMYGCTLPHPNPRRDGTFDLPPHSRVPAAALIPPHTALPTYRDGAAAASLARADAGRAGRRRARL